jgi:peroxiredoxin
VALAGLAGCASFEGGGADAPSDKSGLVGNPAPDFTVKLVKNASGAMALKDLRGKVVLLDFWGTFCVPCRQSFPKLQELQAKFGSSLKVVGISEDEPETQGKIPAFADTYGAKFPLGWDEDHSISHSYPGPMPSSFLIDQKGVVRFAHLTYHPGEEAQVESEIKELLGQ